MPITTEVLMPQSKNENHEALLRWISRVQSELGHMTGEAVFKSLIEECGGLRMRLPDMQDLTREAEMKRIKMLFARGSTYSELAINFDRTERHIRRIVHEKD
jgi:Mor family transcriptional regulator